MRPIRLTLLTVLTTGMLVAGAGAASAEVTTCINYNPQRPIICVG